MFEYLFKEGGRLEQVLPVDPGSVVRHDLLFDSLSDLVESLLLQTQALRVVLPLQQHHNISATNITIDYTQELDIHKCTRRLKTKTNPFEIEEVLLEGFSRLRLSAFVDDVRVLFVATAFVVLTTVVLPIAQTHPAEVGFAVGTLLPKNIQ